MSKSISGRQLKYAISAFIIASSLLTSNLYMFARNDAWVAVLIAFIASVSIIGIYTTLSKRYPGLSLLDITTAVFGKILGKGISTLYVFYFLSLSYFNTRNLGDFIISMVLPHTPMTLILVSFVIICAMAVRKGPVVMTRYGFLVAITAILAILINAMLLLNVTKLNNLQPAFTLPAENYLIGAHIVTMLPFCEIMSFMMFIPAMQKPEEFGRAMRIGLCFGAATLILIVLRDITVLGPYTTSITMPTFSSIRMIDIGDLLTRMEIIYAVILISLLFFKVSIVYYATVSGIGRLFETESYRPLIYILGALIVLYAEASFAASTEHVEWNMTAAATYSTFFLFFLPMLTLIVSWLRGRNKGRPEAYQEAPS